MVIGDENIHECVEKRSILRIDTYGSLPRIFETRIKMFTFLKKAFVFKFKASKKRVATLWLQLLFTFRAVF